MSFLDKIFSKDDELPNWTPTHRATINDVSFDELRTTLGSGKKSTDNFTFWSGRLSDLDPDYPEDEYFQLSNLDWRFGKDQKPRVTNREQWYLYATSRKGIRQVADEVGGLPRDIKEL